MLMIDFRFSVFRNSFKDTCSLTTHYLIDVIHLRAFFLLIFLTVLALGCDSWAVNKKTECALTPNKLY